MDPNQSQQNPMAALQSLFGNASPAAVQPPMQTAPPAPAQAQPAPMQQQQPQQGMNPMIQNLMGQAQQSMNAPMGQAVPQRAGLIDALKHPLVAALIKGLANAAQSFGWTAMQPSERLERTQLQQQKGEALSRLALTGAEYEGNLGVRQQNANTNEQKADTGAKAQSSLADYRNFQKQNQQDKLQLAQDANQWKQEMAAGRLDKAQQLIDQKATQFEQKIALAQKQFGLDETKVELMGEGLGIKQGMLDLARTALSQKGTVEGAQTSAKLQQFKIEHPILSQFMDMSDLDQLVGGAGTAGIPGVAPTQAPVVSQPSTTSNVGPPTNKAQAKNPNKASGKQWNAVTGRYE